MTTDISSEFGFEKKIKNYQQGVDYLVDKTGNVYTIVSEKLKKIIWPGESFHYDEFIVTIDKHRELITRVGFVSSKENIDNRVDFIERLARNLGREKVLWERKWQGERNEYEEKLSVKVGGDVNCEAEKHRQSLSEFQEKKRWMETVLWEEKNEIHGKCDYKNGWSKEKQLASVRESIAGWEKKIQEERDWLIRNDTQQRNQIGGNEERGLITSRECNDNNLLGKDNFDYNSWTKDQFIAEINRLKKENEQLKSNPTLTSSEKQERMQQNQQKLEKLEKSYPLNKLDNSPKSNNLPTNLIIGGTLLAVMGLISFLVIRKTFKIKKQS